LNNQNYKSEPELPDDDLSPEDFGHEDAETPRDERDKSPSTIERLADANRIQLTETSMKISGKDALSREEIGQIIRDVKLFMASNGISQETVARENDHSSATISQFLRGKYNANPTNIAKRLVTWMEQHARRSNIPKPSPYVTTWIAEQIAAAVRHAMDLICMAAIICPAGAGKTTVLKVIVAEHGGIYISCTRGMTPRAIYREIAEALGYRKSSGTLGDLLSFILAALRDTKRLIVLDEAHLMQKHIGCVRAIFDGANVPIIMAGASEILDWINDRNDGAGQFSSRTMRRNLLDVIQTSGRPDGKGARCKMLFTQDEVRRFLSNMKIRLTSGGLEMAWRLACLPAHGTLRLVMHLVCTLAKTGLEEIGRDEILDALTAWCGPSECLQITRMADAVADTRLVAVAAKAG
jgi:DNA transposition AAA+ family ATPase